MEETLEALEALEMLKAFESVGADRFDVTQTSLEQEKVYFRPGRNRAAMRMMLPQLVASSWKLHRSLIVRPRRNPGVALAQLDDLDWPKLERMRSRAFLAVETSPGNYQAWLAIKGGDDNLIRRLVKGIGVDWNASRAVRVAGSPNCKLKYAPNFPRVRIESLQPGRTVAPAELDADLAPALSYPTPRQLGGGGWPDYERCLRGAPLKKDGTPDRSLPDYLWSKWALERGHSPAAVGAKLLEVSEKARSEWDRGNENYVLRTVDAAARAVR